MSFVISARMRCCLHLNITCNHLFASNELQIGMSIKGRLVCQINVFFIHGPCVVYFEFDEACLLFINYGCRS